MPHYQRILVKAFGGPNVLELDKSSPLPAPGPGEVRVAVQAAGVSFIDTAYRRGKVPDYRGGVPFTPGYEFVGKVDALGSGVTGVAVGDRVADISLTGGYATHVIRPAAKLVTIPPDLDPAIAACVPLVWLTAWQMLTRVRDLPKGSWILVVGASGGVGTALLTIAKHLDLKVIGTASAKNLARVKGQAAAAFDYNDPDLVKRVRTTSGGGVAAAFDAIGGKSARSAHDCLKPGGVFVSYGAQDFLSGKSSMVAMLGGVARMLVLWNLPRGLGSGRGSAQMYLVEKRRDKHPDQYAEDVRTLCAKLADGTLQPPAVERIPLSKVREAHEAIDAGSANKKFVIDMALPA